MEFNPKYLAHMDEMVKHPCGRKALIEDVTMKHNDIRQDVATPYDICGEMCDLVVGKADKYIVFFSLEFLEVLVFEKGIDPKNIAFVGDFYIEAGLASIMYGVNVVTITKNDDIKNGKFSNDIFTFLAIDKQKEINNSESDMKFNKVAVLGNTFYNSNSNGKDSAPLYRLFVESVIDNLNPDYFSFIIPSRGRCLDAHRERIKKIVRFAGEKEVFKSIAIKGGVNYFLFEKDYNGECEFVVGNTTSKRYLNQYDIILQDNNAVGILEKVMNKSTKFISQTCYGNKPFGLATNFSDFTDSGIKCIAIKQSEHFVDADVFTDKNAIIGKWKVCMSRDTSEGNITPDANGAVGIATNFFIIGPNSICTETYIVVNIFDNKKEAEIFISYMKTKFFRFMLSLRIAGIVVNKEKFAWVPDMLDYSTAWTDKELYEHFKLTRQEVAYIESKIKAI